MKYLIITDGYIESLLSDYTYNSEGNNEKFHGYYLVSSEDEIKTVIDRWAKDGNNKVLESSIKVDWENLTITFKSTEEWTEINSDKDYDYENIWQLLKTKEV